MRPEGAPCSYDTHESPRLHAIAHGGPGECDTGIEEIDLVPEHGRRADNEKCDDAKDRIDSQQVGRDLADVADRPRPSWEYQDGDGQREGRQIDDEAPFAEAQVFPRIDGATCRQEAEVEDDEDEERGGTGRMRHGREPQECKQPDSP